MASKQQELLRAATVNAQETKQRLEEEVLNTQSRNTAINQQNIQLKEQLENLEAKHAKVCQIHFQPGYSASPYITIVTDRSCKIAWIKYSSKGMQQ